jgi:membrane protease YdiL (CAAX protease family)
LQNTPGEGRASRVNPSFVRLAGLFYGGLVLAASLWNGLRGRDLELLGDSPPAGAALGLLAAAGTVALGVGAYRMVPAMRKISSELAPHLVDNARKSDLLLVALFSGVGEEVFFRGAVQPEFGLVVASLAFGLVHVGPDRRYLLWTAWAVLAGFLFGALYQVSGGLLAPIVAHVTHNAATLLLWKRSRAEAGEAS